MANIICTLFITIVAFFMISNIECIPRARQSFQVRPYRFKDVTEALNHMQRFLTDRMSSDEKCERYAVLLHMATTTSGVPDDLQVADLAMMRNNNLKARYQEINAESLRFMYVDAIRKYRNSRLAPAFLGLVECLSKFTAFDAEAREFFNDPELNQLVEQYRDLLGLPVRSVTHGCLLVDQYQPILQRTLADTFGNYYRGNQVCAGAVAFAGPATGNRAPQAVAFARVQPSPPMMQPHLQQQPTNIAAQQPMMQPVPQQPMRQVHPIPQQQPHFVPQQQPQMAIAAAQVAPQVAQMQPQVPAIQQHHQPQVMPQQQAVQRQPEPMVQLTIGAPQQRPHVQPAIVQPMPQPQPQPMIQPVSQMQPQVQPQMQPQVQPQMQQQLQPQMPVMQQQPLPVAPAVVQQPQPQQQLPPAPQPQQQLPQESAPVQPLTDEEAQFVEEMIDGLVQTYLSLPQTAQLYDRCVAYRDVLDGNDKVAQVVDDVVRNVSDRLSRAPSQDRPFKPEKAVIDNFLFILRAFQPAEETDRETFIDLVDCVSQSAETDLDVQSFLTHPETKALLEVED